MKNLRFSFVLAIFGHFSLALLNHGARAEHAARLRVKKTASDDAPASPSNVVVHGGTGIGSFQDIQVPVNEDYALRGDGTAAAEENLNHSGFLIQAGIGYLVKRGDWSINALDFDAFQVKTSGGPAATQSSSYTRLNLQTVVKYHFLLGELNGYAGLKAGVRRSSFDNVSSAHYIDSALVGGLVGLAGEFHSLELAAATAPIAKVGYSEDGMFGGKTFKRSAASLGEFSVVYSYALRENVWLDLGFEDEIAHVQIDDVNEYNDLGYGLNVVDTTRPNRTYNLTTTAARIGVRKQF